MEITKQKSKARTKGYFKIGYIFFDSHVRNIGPKAALTYLCIKGYEYKNTRIAWPSEELIAENIGMSPKTVSRAVKILEAHKFIIKSKKKYLGHWYHNEYYLTHSSEWLTTPIFKKDIHKTNVPLLVDKKDEMRETESPIKNNNTKRIKEVLLEEQEKNANSKDLELIKGLNLLKEKMNVNKFK